MTKQGKVNFFVYYIAAIAATGGLLFGFDTGVISGAILFIEKDWTLTSTMEGIVVSCVLVGALTGSLVSGKLADHFGRRSIIMVTAFIFFLGSLGTAFAPTLEVLIAGRIVIGIAIGIASFTVPLYLSEISPSKVRGTLVSLNQLAITIGIVVSYLSDAHFESYQHAWRWMFGVGILPAMVLFVGMCFLPRTPRWLMSKNKEEETRTVLAKIDPQANLDEQITEMKNSIALESGGRYKDLLASWIRPALFIGIGLMFIQQFTGINTVIYYAPKIFQKSGFVSDAAAIYATVGVGIVNVLMTIVSILLLDRFGRKPLIYIGLSGIVVSLIALGAAFHFEAALGDNLKWFAIGSLIVYIASFAVSLGPICWLIIAEIYPLKIRGVAMSIATFCNWLFNFIIALTFPILLEHIGTPQTFVLYAAVGIVGIFFCKLYVPETKGHSLEIIEKHWKDNKHPLEL